MGVNPIVDYDYTQAQLVARLNALKPQGYRLLSLSAYGNDSDHPQASARQELADASHRPLYHWAAADHAPADGAVARDRTGGR